METINEESLSPHFDDPNVEDLDEVEEEEEEEQLSPAAASGGADEGDADTGKEVAPAPAPAPASASASASAADPRSSEGKIFIGGLPKETTDEEFKAHFAFYGDLSDSVIMRDRNTHHPRGFGFVTYIDPLVVDDVISKTHVFDGKTVEIKRTIPRGATATGTKDFKTKKLFVGGIPITVTDDEFKDFFAKFGDIKEHMIMRDHSTSRSRGFGFVTFTTDEAVDELLSKGNKIDFAGGQVEIKKAEPKKSSNPLPPPHFRSSRSAYGGGYRDAYGAGGYGAGAGAYMAGGGYGTAAYSGYLASQYNSGYGGYGPYRGGSSLGYPGALGGDYDVGGFERPTGSYGYGPYYSDLGAGYDSATGGGGPNASRRGYGGNANGRFHPYSSGTKLSWALMLIIGCGASCYMLSAGLRGRQKQLNFQGKEDSVPWILDSRLTGGWIEVTQAKHTVIVMIVKEFT